MATYSMNELFECAKREIGQRKSLYPRLVESKKMSDARAKREIAMMEAIAAHFEEPAKRERANTDLLMRM